MIAWSWLPFGGLCHFHGGDVDCGRQFLWTPLGHPPCQEDIVAEIPDHEIAHGSVCRKLRKWRFRFEERSEGVSAAR